MLALRAAVLVISVVCLTHASLSPSSSITSDMTLPVVSLNPQDVTVSGLSAGAFMAVQYHVAFSSQISGAGIIAGGPYYCAQNDVTIATSACMDLPDLISVTALVAETKVIEATNQIDDLANLAGNKVWMFSGLNDTVVYQGVMLKLVEYYENFVDTSLIETVFNFSAEHSFPTTNYGNECIYLGSPYINNCGFDAAGAMLNHILGNLSSPVEAIKENLMGFSQEYYFNSPIFKPVDVGLSPSEAGLSPYAYIYVPTACQNSSTQCRLHINFHGCEQTLADIGTVYVLNTGLNGWAEANNIVVLYPQAQSNSLNPKGCFDWWGYTGVEYPTKVGYQMATVGNMMNTLLSGKEFMHDIAEV